MKSSVIIRGVAVVLLTLVAGSCALFESAAGGRDDGGPAGDTTRETGDERAGRPDSPERLDRGEAEATPREDGQSQADAEAGEETTGHTVLAAGDQSAVRIPLARAIADAQLWADFWAAHTANRPEPPERPAVDFDTETVVVLLLGERPTGGYGVRIVRVEESRRTVEVVVAVERPVPGETVTQALTSPYYIAMVPVSGKELVFTGDDVEAGFLGD